MKLAPGISDLAKCGRLAGERCASDEYMIANWNVKRYVGEVIAANPNHQVADSSYLSTHGGELGRVDPLGQDPDFLRTNTARSVRKVC